jgi:hypothetical protein
MLRGLLHVDGEAYVREQRAEHYAHRLAAADYAEAVECTDLNVNDVLQALNHLSPIKYAIANLAPYSMHGQVFHR